MRDLIGAVIALAVGEVLVLIAHGNGIRGSCHLGFKQLVETLVVRILRRRGVPLHE
jgi:hypothetical protein